MGWRDKVKTARLPEDVVKLVMRGDLAAEHEQLVADLEQAKERGASSLAGNATAPIEARIREIEAEMQDSVVEFRFRALPRSKRPGDDRPSWAELSAAHPPRVDDDGVMDARDRMAGGINRDTFPEPMLRACLIAIDDEEFDGKIGDADWDDLMPQLTAAQFDQLVNTGWALNRGVVDVPFWPGNSKPTPASVPG